MTANRERVILKKTNHNYREKKKYAYVLETFDRDDRYCEYDSNVVAIYSKENFKEAKEHWKKLCKGRTNKGDEVEKWRRDGGYFYNCESESCENYRFSYVGVKKMKVQ